MAKAAKRFSFALLLDGRGGARELSDAEVDDWTPAEGAGIVALKDMLAFFGLRMDLEGL